MLSRNILSRHEGHAIVPDEVRPSLLDSKQAASVQSTILEIPTMFGHPQEQPVLGIQPSARILLIHPKFL